MNIKTNIKMLTLMDEETGDKHKIAATRPIEEVAMAARVAEWEFIKDEVADTIEAFCSRSYH